MNPKIVKFVIKGVISLGISAVIGYVIKGQDSIDTAVDEFFSSRYKK